MAVTSSSRVSAVALLCACWLSAEAVQVRRTRLRGLEPAKDDAAGDTATANAPSASASPAAASEEDAETAARVETLRAAKEAQDAQRERDWTPQAAPQSAVMRLIDAHNGLFQEVSYDKESGAELLGSMHTWSVIEKGFKGEGGEAMYYVDETGAPWTLEALQGWQHM